MDEVLRIALAEPLRPVAAPAAEAPAEPEVGDDAITH
jgi:hypothetical protein